MFVLSSEILGNYVRNKKDVKGILVGKTEILISQYADDTTFILDASEESLLKTLAVLEFGTFWTLIQSQL